MDIKEQKLAAARKKLRQYQKKKEARNPSNSSSRENTPNHEPGDYYDKSGSLSRTSSVGEYNNEHYKQNGSSIKNLGLNSPTSDNISSNGIGSSIDIENKGSFLYYHDQNECSSHLHTEDILPKPITKSREVTPPVFGSSSSNTTLSDNLVRNGSVSSETNVTGTTEICMDGNSSKTASLRSTNETLRQLSFQMSGLVQDSEHQGADFKPELFTIELEKRNNELAVYLEQERQNSFQYSQLNEELKQRISSLQSQLETLQNTTAHTSTNNVEVSGLREQLQVHIQTIGVLVAEKSELQSTLAHSRHALEQRTVEATELQGRLDASRHRVRELEASTQELELQNSSLSHSLESANQHLSNLQTNNSKNSKLQEELKASSAELKERLALKTEENQKLTSELTEVKKQLDLAQVHINQLRDNTLEDMTKQFDQLQTSFNDSQNRIQFLNNSLESSRQERVQMEKEYKNYASQLALEVEALKEKLCEEREVGKELQNKNVELLEKLNASQKPQPHPSTSQLAKDIEVLKSTKQALESEKNSLMARIENLENDNGNLSHLMSQQRKKLEELEEEVERKGNQEVDTSQLLQSMQSDKVAAARALSQNKQLKHQLEELQNGLILMSNKKLELTEKLETELHGKKKLNLELFALGDQVSSLKESLLLKERENETLRKVCSKQPSLPKSIEDEDSSGNVEVEDGSLTEIHEHDHCQHSHESDVPSNDVTRDVVNVKRASKQEGIDQTNSEGDSSLINGLVIVSNEAAQNALEKKFTDCMGELATVSDEKQRLEHLVQQLQMETDTVGDYITIYQFQRGVMKKRMEELTSELECLRLDKDQMRKKLSTLQDLVSQLVLDKVPSEEKLISGLYSFINSNESTKESDSSDTMSSENSTKSSNNVIPNKSVCKKTEEQSELETGTTDKPKDLTGSTDTTVQRIMSLINEMEVANQIDHSLLQEFHHCPLCSGKLITI